MVYFLSSNNKFLTHFLSRFIGLQLSLDFVRKEIPSKHMVQGCCLHLGSCRCVLENISNVFIIVQMSFLDIFRSLVLFHTLCIEVG